MDIRGAFFAATLCTLIVDCAAIDIDPLTTRWTFGAHEPYTMYRRVGNHCTGGIDGNAQWVQEWLDWFDEKSPEVMEGLGLNFLHSRFYKGMGWEVEKKDFPNVKKFVKNCHAHGVKALAYVQFNTLYPEAMRREIPDVDSWAGIDYMGRKNLYGGYNGQYFRWAPCLNCKEWEEYTKRMCKIALTEGGFDGIMFDNVFDYPCYCERCQREFRTYLSKISNPAERFGFDDLSWMLLPRLEMSRLNHMDVKDPVLQSWTLWRCEVMNGVMRRFREHIKSVKPDAIVSGNPSPYRSRSRFIERAQNMAELCDEFDFIIMQNANFPELLADGRIVNRVRELKYAQDMRQRIVALCDTDTKIIPKREEKFLLPFIEDIVFGGIPTDRTIISPSPQPGFINRETYARRKPLHDRFNAFVKRCREALASPTIHSVRIFYPSREILFSETTHQGVAAAEEIFLRNRVPYGYLVARPDRPIKVPAGTDVIVVPGLVSLSDAQIEVLSRWARDGGRLVVTGDSGRYDDWNAQRRTNTFLPRISGIPNVSVRPAVDRVAAKIGWRTLVLPPKDGGKALMNDLAKVGWTAPVEFSGLPPHVFAEYRRLSSGRIAVHLINYDPDRPVSGAKVALTEGAGATFEEPFGDDGAVRKIAGDGRIPDFKFYALLIVEKSAESPCTVDPIEDAVAARDAALDAEWRKVSSREEFDRKCSAFKESFRRVTGYHDIKRTPLNVKQFGVKDYGAFRVEKVMIESAPGAYVPLLVFLPDEKKFKPPYAGYVFIPGHSANGKGLPAYLHTCELGARNGLASVIYDPLGQGERSQGSGIRNADEHVRIGAYAALLGETTATYMLRDACRVLDYLESRPDIDPDRLGATGNSGGGTLSAFLMVVDGRVKAAAPSCYLSSAREHLKTCGPQDAEQNFFGGWKWGFNHASLVFGAGSPVLINAAVDDFFQIEGSRSTFAIVKEVAAKVGLPEDMFELSEAPGKHAMSKMHREQAVRFLLKHLAGKVAEVVETETTKFGKADYTVTAEGEVSRLAGFRSVYEDIADRFKERGVSVDQAAKNAAPLVLKELAGSDCKGVLATLKGDFSEGRKPVLRIGGPAKSGEASATLFAEGPRYVMRTKRSGKLSYYENRKTDEVVAVDLYVEGRSLVALRAAELLTLAAELRRRTGVAPSVVAEGRFATVARFAAAADPSAFASVEFVNEPKPFDEALKARDYLSFADSGAMYSGRVSHSSVGSRSCR